MVLVHAILLAVVNYVPAQTPVPPPALSWVFRTNSSLGYSHMAMIEPTGGLSLVAAWQGAKVHEGYNDQDIYVVRSADGGTTWSDVRGGAAINPHGAFAVWGPVLHHESEATPPTLHLFYAASGAFDQTPTAGRSGVGGDILRVESVDGGATWGGARVVLPYADDATNATAPKITANKLVVLRHGRAAVAGGNRTDRAAAEAQRWVLPFWQSPRSEWNNTAPQAVGVLISDDRGGSWRPVYLRAPPTKLIENTLAETADGTLLMLFRTGVGKLYRAFSHDRGESWTDAAPSGLPNPNAKTFVFSDSREQQILAYNPTTKGRNPLALAVSSDGGMSFAQFANLDPGVTGKDLEYPTTCELNGTLLTVFSADHYTGIKLARTPLP